MKETIQHRPLESTDMCGTCARAPAHTCPQRVKYTLIQKHRAANIVNMCSLCSILF